MDNMEYANRILVYFENFSLNAKYKDYTGVVVKTGWKNTKEFWKMLIKILK